jgi:soluble lytic murein transglycosylase-like protein
VNAEDRYDSLLEYYWAVAEQKYSLTDADWRLLKCQVRQESGFNPNAVSPVGAKGLMQFMDGTWGADHDSPFNPEASIRRGADYLGSLWQEFKAEQGLERWRFGLASYNAGLGNVLKAQALAQKAKKITDTWWIVGGFMRQVTGPDNALETLEYVRVILSGYMAVRAA